jgi:RecA-family ATPase
MTDDLNAQPEGARHPFRSVGNDAGPAVRPFRFPPLETIPPRPWLYGTWILRGYVSILSGPTDPLTTDCAVGLGLALASGQSIYGEEFCRRCAVGLVSREHDAEDLVARSLAIVATHRIDLSLVEGKYFMVEDQWTMSPRMQRWDPIAYPDDKALVEMIHSRKLGVLIVDGFARLDELREPRCPRYHAALRAWRRIGRTAGCAIVLVQNVMGMAREMSTLRIVLDRSPPELVWGTGPAGHFTSKET